MESSLLYGLLGIIAAYLVLRLTFMWRGRQRVVTSIDRELRDVLTKDEYKVKGRFE